MPGAVRLAGESALRVGAGLVTVAVAPENVAAISAGCPELIVVGLDVPQFGELPCHPGVAFEALLTRKTGEPLRLRHIAVVGGNKEEFQVQAAQPDQPAHVVQADRGAAGLPARDRRLRGVGPCS